MENKKRLNKLIILFIAIALCALVLILIFCFNNPNKDVSPVSFIDGQTDENQTGTNTENGISTADGYEVSGKDGTGTGIGDGTSGIGVPGTNAEGEGNGIFSGNGNAINGRLDINENGNGQIGTGDGQSSGNGPGFVEDGNGAYSADAQIETNSEIEEIISRNGGKEYTPDYDEDDDDNSGKSNIKQYDNWNLSVKGNDYSNIDLKLNLLNAPYNNDEYCENMLKQNSFSIKLTSKPEGSICTGYPDKVITRGDGQLNVSKHVYTKTGNINLSETSFNQLGDYVFSIYPENSDKELYQIIVSLRGLTKEDGTPLWKTYSLIQIKSSLKNGEKVNNININIKNPNTAIIIDKIKNVNSFWEQVYVDVYIDSYENAKYTVVDGNVTDDASAKIGNHYVVRTAKKNIIPQTYILANDGKILIGKKAGGSVSSILKIASTNVSDNSKIAKTDATTDMYEVPTGTKFRAEFSAEKKYREDYDMEGGGEFRVSKENVDENEVIISNTTNSNPKTGIFYNIIPFVLVIALAIIGIIIMKKTSIKDDKEDDNE